mgnify:CR=1 FL=1
MSKKRKEALKKLKHKQRKKGKLEQISIPYDSGGGHMGTKDLENYNGTYQDILKKLDPSEMDNFKRMYKSPSKDNYQKLRQMYRDIFYK